MSVPWERLDWRAAGPLIALYAGVAAALLRYHGLQHDAQAYVLQALAILDPTVLADDLFLRFGSQDRFTLFSNVSSWWIAALGIDHGAAALTAVSLVLFHLAAWILVRELSNSASAWLAIGLLLVVPGWYGSGGVFVVAERFLTARLPAEALSLLAIAAVAARRFRTGALLFGLAAVTHPLMTLPAVCMVATAEVARRYRFLGSGLVGAALIGAFLLAGIALGLREPWMSGDWLAATRARSDFLFLDLWRLADWPHVVVTMATLILAGRSLPKDPAAGIVRASLVVAIAGLAAAAIVSWGPPIKWVIQAQTWRWIWPATVLSIGLLPAILQHLIRSADGDRCAGFLLLTAWVLSTADRSSQSLHVVAIAAATLAAIVPFIWNAIPPTARGPATRAAGLVAAFAAAWALSLVMTEATLDLDLGGDPRWVQTVIGMISIPACGASLIYLAWRSVQAPARQLAAPVVAIAGTVLLAGAAPRWWDLWTTERFGRPVQEKFAQWRAVIAPTSEVFWPDQLQATWFALGRRSYLSKSQLGGIVFSAGTTAEARRRAHELAKVFPPGQWFNETSGVDRSRWATSIASVRDACEADDLAFVVASANFGTDLPSVEWPMKGQRAYLYDCAQIRRGTP